jgi:hypothetical protein
VRLTVEDCGQNSEGRLWSPTYALAPDRVSEIEYARAAELQRILA